MPSALVAVVVVVVLVIVVGGGASVFTGLFDDRFAGRFNFDNV